MSEAETHADHIDVVLGIFGFCGSTANVARHFINSA